MSVSEDIMTVDVKVSKPLKEYILAINDGSDTIVPDKHSLLWALVKTQLDLVPTDYRPINPREREEYIRIGLTKSRNTKSYNVNTLRTMEINTLFRCYLTEAGQRTIAKYLLKNLKMNFRSYVGGALSNNPGLNIKDAIEEFCNDHKIAMEHITYEMLRKDWYRFKLRTGDRGVIPIENHNL